MSMCRHGARRRRHFDSVHQRRIELIDNAIFAAPTTRQLPDRFSDAASGADPDINFKLGVRRYLVEVYGLLAKRIVYELGKVPKRPVCLRKRSMTQIEAFPKLPFKNFGFCSARKQVGPAARRRLLRCADVT